MLLIIEFILTIVAWTKGGWKWLSLIPVGSAFFIGIIVGSSGAVSSNDLINFIWVDILAIIALIIMIVKPKKIQEKNT